MLWRTQIGVESNHYKTEDWHETRIIYIIGCVAGDVSRKLASTLAGGGLK